jgi:hypothetical protein
MFLLPRFPTAHGLSSVVVPITKSWWTVERLNPPPQGDDEDLMDVGFGQSLFPTLPRPVFSAVCRMAYPLDRDQ